MNDFKTLIFFQSKNEKDQNPFEHFVREAVVIITTFYDIPELNQRKIKRVYPGNVYQKFTRNNA